MLLPRLEAPDPSIDVDPSGSQRVTATIRVANRALSFHELAIASHVLAADLTPGTRIAVAAERTIETVVAVVAGLLAGAAVVPLNPTATAPELVHQLGDAEPSVVLHPIGTSAPAGTPTDRLHGVDVDALLGASVADRPPIPRPLDPTSPALVMYTSGTTGPPKGAVLSHAAIAANLDALAAVWNWQSHDVLVHALPLYHVHGLVLGVLLPLRTGTGLHHLGAFDVDATAAALDAAGTVHFGVPTIYHRLADAADERPDVADALRRARLLVSGSAGLPAAVHQRVLRTTGQTIVERYGMTETLITTAVPAGTTDEAGTVGPALPGVAVRVIDDDGDEVPHDATTMGQLLVRTPSAFSGYLHRADATAASWRGDWFVTGDVATIDAEGYVRIVGRASTDIIKSGGFKIGTGEIEDVLTSCEGVGEAAVVGVPDDELGERIEAWLVPDTSADESADRSADESVDRSVDPSVDLESVRAHVAARLAAHKRPRSYHVVDELPRNSLGKVQKARLRP